MKLLTALLFSSFLFITGCTTTSSGLGSKDTLSAICSRAPVIHLAFAVYNKEHPQSKSIVNKEKNAYYVVSQVCKNPGSNPEETLTKALEAYADLINVSNEMEK